MIENSDILCILASFGNIIIRRTGIVQDCFHVFVTGLSIVSWNELAIPDEKINIGNVIALNGT